MSNPQRPHGLQPSRLLRPWDFPGKNTRVGCHCLLQQCRRPRFNPCVGKIPWRREWLLTAVSLPEEFHGQRSLEGYNPWGHKESDTTERAFLHCYVFVYFAISFLQYNNAIATTPLLIPCLLTPQLLWVAYFPTQSLFLREEEQPHQQRLFCILRAPKKVSTGMF